MITHSIAHTKKTPKLAHFGSCVDLLDNQKGKWSLFKRMVITIYTKGNLFLILDGGNPAHVCAKVEKLVLGPN
jgi:hypothetical protein